MNEKNVCTTTVVQGLCVGCGVCAGICPHGNLTMAPSDEGGYHPRSQGACKISCTECLQVCPFLTGEHNDETALARGLFGQQPEIRHTPETGYYLQTYVGHVTDPGHRWQGASGGMASWFLQRLLRERVVDHVLCVTASPDPGRLFHFQILSTPEAVLSSAKSAYYPVELSTVVRTVLEQEGRYAVIGLPCFIKALRLAASRNKKLHTRLVVFLGLICGQYKTKGFAESLIRHMGADPKEITAVCFREKVKERPASNFSVSASGAKNRFVTPWSDFCGLAWMSGMFKLPSCDFCDDVFAELADISFMDAWLPEYAQESAGTSIVITRSAMAQDIVVRCGIDSGACSLVPLPVSKVIESQQFVLYNKRDLLSRRLWVAARGGRPVPRKRVGAVRPNLLDYGLISNAEKVRKHSQVALRKQRESGQPGLAVFLREIEKPMSQRRWLYRMRPVNMRNGLRRRFLALVHRFSRPSSRPTPPSQ